ncbi:MAG: metal ABC transporter permease [Candidatus Thermoplasmatota archaeon]|nr:metal ABC transporter permease [Candidatus Thermoplasmatota archaeon]
MVGDFIIEVLGPVLESLEPIVPGEWFPLYFIRPYLQRPLIAAVFVAMVAGFLGSFLLIRNLALIGDGLAHVSFGAIAIGLVVGIVDPLIWAFVLCVISAILIDFLQVKKWLTGDTAIAIFLTGMLGLGIVVTRLYGGGSLISVEGYLWGNLNLIDSDSFEFIMIACIISYLSLAILYHSLLLISIDPIAARIQGLPVRFIRLYWSILTAAVVVSMVQFVGVLLVTALIVTPAAIAQLLSRSFFMCVVLSQILGVVTVLLGLYYSAELSTDSGAMIALVSAIMFVVVAVSKGLIKQFTAADNNSN